VPRDRQRFALQLLGPGDSDCTNKPWLTVGTWPDSDYGAPRKIELTTALLAAMDTSKLPPSTLARFLPRADKPDRS
jgi:hypothetical protein